MCISLLWNGFPHLIKRNVDALISWNCRDLCDRILKLSITPHTWIHTDYSFFFYYYFFGPCYFSFADEEFHCNKTSEQLWCIINFSILSDQHWYPENWASALDHTHSRAWKRRGIRMIEEILMGYPVKTRSALSVDFVFSKWWVFIS